MTYILLSCEKYGYFQSFDNYPVYTQDFRKAANYKYLDAAMEVRDTLNRLFDEDYHIEVFSVGD